MTQSNEYVACDESTAPWQDCVTIFIHLTGPVYTVVNQKTSLNGGRGHKIYIIALESDCSSLIYFQQLRLCLNNFNYYNLQRLKIRLKTYLYRFEIRTQSIGDNRKSTLTIFE